MRHYKWWFSSRTNSETAETERRIHRAARAALTGVEDGRRAGSHGCLDARFRRRPRRSVTAGNAVTGLARATSSPPGGARLPGARRARLRPPPAPARMPRRAPSATSTRPAGEPRCRPPRMRSRRRRPTTPIAEGTSGGPARRARVRTGSARGSPTGAGRAADRRARRGDRRRERGVRRAPRTRRRRGRGRGGGGT